MKKGINLWAFPAGTSIREALELAKKAGFEAIEVNAAEEGEVTLSSTEADMKRIVEQAKEFGLELVGLSTGLFWKYPITSSDESVREKGKGVCRKMLDLATWLGVDAILMVPGSVGSSFAPVEPVPYDVAYKRAKDALLELKEYAEKTKVAIGVENVWNMFLTSPFDMARFLDEIDSPYVKAYFDVGNVVVNAYPEHWIRILGKRIVRVHFKDFKRAIGNINGFVNLLEGDVNWPEVIKALQEVGYDSYVTAEMSPYKCYPDQLIYDTSAAMDRILGRC